MKRGKLSSNWSSNVVNAAEGLREENESSMIVRHVVKPGNWGDYDWYARANATQQNLRVSL